MSYGSDVLNTKFIIHIRQQYRVLTGLRRVLFKNSKVSLLKEEERKWVYEPVNVGVLILEQLHLPALPNTDRWRMAGACCRRVPLHAGRPHTDFETCRDPRFVDVWLLTQPYCIWYPATKKRGNNMWFYFHKLIVLWRERCFILKTGFYLRHLCMWL